MFELIARLRARPVAYRRRVAFLVSAGITAVIVVVWLITLVVGFDTPAPSSPEVAVPGPFETLIKRFENTF